MKKFPTTLATVVAAFAVFLAWQGLGGTSSAPASAVGAVQTGDANFHLVGSSQTWNIISKAGFLANRVVVEVGVPAGLPAGQKKVLEATFTCGGEDIPGQQKPSIIGANPNEPALPDHEVWSATFSDKCVGEPNIPVSVTLVPADPENKPVIKVVRVQNTIPQQGAINVRRIGHSRNWKVTFKDPDKGYNRVELYVGTGTTANKVRRVVFRCQSTRERVRGEFKRLDVNVNPNDPGRPNHEVWSATFSRKCTGGVRAHFLPTRCPEDVEGDDIETRCDRRNRVIVKGGLALNTIPDEGRANAVLKAKSQTFKLTSKADFAANRVEVDVATFGTAATPKKIDTAVFWCQTATGVDVLKVNGQNKGIVPNRTPPPVGGPPNDEVWAGDFGNTKCIAANGGGVRVKFTLTDPENQAVVKAARVQNTLGPKPTPTPRGVQAATCEKIEPQPVDLPHHPVYQTGWQKWKCTPEDPLFDWNRVTIYVDVTSPLPAGQKKLDTVQFDCQDNVNPTTHFGSKALHVDQKFALSAFPDKEIWSGEDFIDPKSGLAKNCHGGVSVFLHPHDPDNHPQINKARFTHTGPSKKPVPNGQCDPADPVTNPQPNTWTCLSFDNIRFSRIDISVGTQTLDRKLGVAIFECGGISITGDLKMHKVNDDPRFLFAEVWSVNFSPACSGKVTVILQPVPVSPRNVPVIKKVFFTACVAAACP